MFAILSVCTAPKSPSVNVGAKSRLSAQQNKTFRIHEPDSITRPGYILLSLNKACYLDILAPKRVSCAIWKSHDPVDASSDSHCGFIAPPPKAVAAAEAEPFKSDC